MEKYISGWMCSRARTQQGSMRCSAPGENRQPSWSQGRSVKRTTTAGVTAIRSSIPQATGTRLSLLRASAICWWRSWTRTKRINKKGLTDLQKSVRPFLLDKFLICTCKPPVTCQKISKYGFDECYQSAIKRGIWKSKKQCLCGFAGPHIHFLLIRTRSCQTFSKQICLCNFAQGIGILFIIQIVEAIWFFVAMVLPTDMHAQYADFPTGDSTNVRSQFYSHSGSVKDNCPSAVILAMVERDLYAVSVKHRFSETFFWIS